MSLTDIVGAISGGFGAHYLLNSTTYYTAAALGGLYPLAILGGGYIGMTALKKISGKGQSAAHR